ncbi:MAG: cobalamin biosynthesis protein CbiG [Parvularculaceae bacterium]|nr:cobalamin biosynthesis protein CbiG [Parvularculaceae bacterium]
MSRLFDGYMAVDWSAANQPTKGKDSIWIAWAAPRTGDLEVANIPTRHAAMQLIEGRVREALAVGHRLLLGFDFAFGYPDGFAQTLTGKAGWQSVWQAWHDAVEDGEDNRSNRFQVASDVNAKLSHALFWGKPHQHKDRYTELPAKRPTDWPVPERRVIEAYVPAAKSVFQLAYNGAVGSQSILGIAHLERLRHARGVSIWPFETQFADNMPSGPCAVLAEIYPSLLVSRAAADEVKDRLQVEAMVKAMADLDKAGRGAELLSPPPQATEEERQTMLREEGSILGVGVL